MGLPMGVLRGVAKNECEVSFEHALNPTALNGDMPVKFVSDELFEHVFQTSAGEIGLLAEIQILETTLWLKDIAVYPTQVDQIRIGTREARNCLNQIMEWALTQGFQELRITGERMSGVSKGRKVEIKRVLK
jgi:hypothetical protein